ncbi:MAG: hypothetical protein QHJ81_12715 [Anaerolineae bacterium]|nr:hypothetical protein [Anaerolineae bacterium]
MRIAVVGPCGSGKTTLVAGLLALGYEARECVQEHSYVPTMWQRISRPDVLIYLDVPLAVIRQRKPRSDWTQAILDEQHRRLAHARAGCHLYLRTEDLTPQEVLQRVVDFLRQLEVRDRF